jgi:hypothetical protein
VIPKEMGIGLARSYGIGFIEISAKKKMNTEEALRALAVMIEVFPLVREDLSKVVREDPIYQKFSQPQNMTQEEIAMLIENSRCKKRTTTNFYT